MTYKNNVHLLGSTNEKYSHEITRDIVNRHLKDINDKISEEDIRKVNTTNLPVSDIEEIEKEELTKNETIAEKNNDGKVSSPWNIID